MGEVKLHALGNYVDEWRKLTKSSSTSVIVVGAVHDSAFVTEPYMKAKSRVMRVRLQTAPRKRTPH